MGLDGFTLVGLLSSCAHVSAFNMEVCLHSIVSEMRVLGNFFCWECSYRYVRKMWGFIRGFCSLGTQ